MILFKMEKQTMNERPAGTLHFVQVNKYLWTDNKFMLDFSASWIKTHTKSNQKVGNDFGASWIKIQEFQCKCIKHPTMSVPL